MSSAAAVKGGVSVANFEVLLWVRVMSLRVGVHVVHESPHGVERGWGEVGWGRVGW